MFYYCPRLTSVTIPTSVASIGDWAFYYCTSLTSITIPNSVASIGDWAFYYCTSLTSITIPNSVTSIGNYAFCDCTSLTSITIPDSVTSIGDWVFYNCTSLTSITIPDSVTSIGDWVFYKCTSLTSITIPDSVTSIGYSAFADTPWLKAQQEKNPLVIVNGILIDGTAASGNVVIPNSVTSIGDQAFYNCTSLTSITIPNSVTSIWNSAFNTCTSLTSITIPNSVTRIGNYAFKGTPWLKAQQEKNPLVVVNGILIDGTAASGNVVIPNSVTRIGDSAFNTCTSLTSITIPNSVTIIGGWAFCACTSLTDVIIPDSVTIIGYCVFNNCTSLTSITIPNSVTSIRDSAFENCTSLTDVYYTGSEAKWNNIDIRDYNSCLTNATIHYNHAPNHTHSYTSKTTKAATCTSTGVKTFTCSCGDTYTQTISKTAHTYKTTVVAPTYAAQGYTLHKCSVCGTSYKDKYTAKKTVPTVTAKSTYTCTTNAVRINWNKVSGATGYKIYRYNPSTKKWTALKAIYDPNVLTYKDSNLKSGTVYKYKVKAFVKSNGKFYFGNSCSTITTATKPATATITKTAKSSTAVRLYWKKVTCTGYKIQRYNATTKKWVDVKTLSSATTNYRIASLKKNTSYKFRVCAYKNDGKKNLLGAWSYVTVKTTM